MLFNSISFLIFLLVVYILYWLMQRGPLRLQNLFLLTASYVFYSWWDYRFLMLLFISSFTDFTIGKALERHRDKRLRRVLLGLSITVNIGILGFFKYFDFFVNSAVDLLTAFGFHPHVSGLNIILPVGISFYTFQSMTYAIDIYRGNIRSVQDPVSYLAFVSFFPQLVAGPIERAKNLLYQFTEKRAFDYSEASDGIRQILWGLFKKMVIADRIAGDADYIFSNFQHLDGIRLLIGVFLFTIQIYCDFSGYSDIAIGTARLFGFRLKQNFAYPYFSRNIVEFWRRWHISLSSWFRDYVYIPLGGNRSSRPRHALNIITTFTLSGLWHGANWTFIAWGFLHSLFYLPVIFGLWKKDYKDTCTEDNLIPDAEEIIKIFITFLSVMLAWVFFRLPHIADCILFLKRMIFLPFDAGIGPQYFRTSVLTCLLLLGFEWSGRNREYFLKIGHLPKPLRWSFYYLVTALILFTGNLHHVPFIYFQF